MTVRFQRAAGWGLAALGLALALLALSPSAQAGHETPPACSITLSGTEGTDAWYRSSVQAFLVTTGNAQATEYSYDGVSNYTYYGGSIGFYAEGSHRLYCTVVDHEGIRFTTFRDFHIDATQPNCAGSYSGTFSPSSGWYTGAGSWSIASSDLLSGLWYTNYTRNGTGPFSYTGPFLLPDGVQTIVCRVTDRAGNTYERTDVAYVDVRPPSSCSVARVYDGSRGVDIAPRAGWYAPGSPDSYGMYVYLGATDDGSGVGLLHVRIDNGSAMTIYPGSSVTIYGEGMRSLSCTAYDGAGNSATYYADLRIDGTRPSCTGTYNGTTGRNGWRVSGVFTLTARDEESGLLTLNTTVAGASASTALSQGVYTYKSPVDREGSYSVTCLVTDQAGLVSQLATFSVKLDRVAPACDVVVSGARGANGWYVQPPRVSIEASDAESGLATTTYQLGAGSEQTYGAAFTHRAEGNTTATCRATDRAGNVGRDTEPLALDTQAPNLCASAARDERGEVVKARREWFAKAVAFELVTDDNVSGLQNVTFELDGKPVPGVSLGTQEARVSLPIDERGAHTITCSAVDRAGHRAGPLSIPVNIDDSLPVCEGRTDGESLAGWNRGETTVTLLASDAGSGIESFLYTLDGGAPREYTTPIPLRGDGNHRVECLVRDLAGNAGTRALDLRLDSTPATCELKGVDPTQLHRAPLLVELAARDNTSGVGRVMYALNGGELRAYAGPINLTEAGVHEITCRVEDVAGNERSVTLERIRAEGPERQVHAAPVPVTPDTQARTSQPIPGAAPLFLAGVAILVALARRR